MEVPKRVVAGERGTELEEEGDEALQGAVSYAGQASGTDFEHVAEVKLGIGAAGKGGVIPDGVDEDVVDGGEGAVAVAGDEDAAGVRAPEPVGGDAGERLQVEGPDQVEQPEPQGARVRRSRDRIVVVLLVALGRRGRGFAWGGAVCRRRYTTRSG
jgi:hypothetical protein